MAKKEKQEEEKKKEEVKEEEPHQLTQREYYDLTVGYIYILENMKDRFDFTHLEMDAINSSIDALHIMIGDSDEQEEVAESTSEPESKGEVKKGKSVPAVAGYA